MLMWQLMCSVHAQAENTLSPLPPILSILLHCFIVLMASRFWILLYPFALIPFGLKTYPILNLINPIPTLMNSICCSFGGENMWKPSQSQFLYCSHMHSNLDKAWPRPNDGLRPSGGINTNLALSIGHSLPPNHSIAKPTAEAVASHLLLVPG